MLCCPVAALLEAGIVLTVYCYDPIESHVCVPVQAQGWCGGGMKYKGMWDVLAQAVEKEGVKGLYKVGLLRFCNIALL